MAKKAKPAQLLEAKANNAVQRDAKGRLLPGQSLNPRGGGASAVTRVARLANHLADKTLDGRMILDDILGIAQTAPREADRLRAYEILLERFVGKAVDVHAFVDLTGSAGARPHSEMAAGLLEHLIRTLPAPTQTHTDDTVEGEVVGADPAADDTKPE